MIRRPDLERFLKKYYRPDKLTPYVISRHMKDLEAYEEDIIAKEDTKTGVGVRFNWKLEVLPMTVPGYPEPTQENVA